MSKVPPCVDNTEEEEEEEDLNVQTDKHLGSVWQNKSKASKLTQEFFVILAVLDVIGSSSIMGSAKLLFIINLDDEFVEVNLKVVGVIRYTIVDGIHKSINVFDVKNLPSLADLVVDWLVDILSLVVLIPILSAGGVAMDIALFVVSVIQTVIVIFIATKIKSRRVKYLTITTVICVAVFGLSLALAMGAFVKDELLNSRGEPLMDNGKDEELPTPGGLKEAVVVITMFIVVTFFSCGVFSASMFYPSHVGSMLFLGPNISSIFDIIFKSRLSLPLFFVIIPLTKCIVLAHWMYGNAIDVYYGLQTAVMNENGEIVFVEDDDDEDVDADHDGVVSAGAGAPATTTTTHF